MVSEWFFARHGPMAVAHEVSTPTPSRGLDPALPYDHQSPEHEGFDQLALRPAVVQQKHGWIAHDAHLPFSAGTS